MPFSIQLCYTNDECTVEKCKVKKLLGLFAHLHLPALWSTVLQATCCASVNASLLPVVGFVASLVCFYVNSVYVISEQKEFKTAMLLIHPTIIHFVGKICFMPIPMGGM